MRKKLVPIIVVMAVFVAAIPALAGGMNYARALGNVRRRSLEWICSDSSLL